MYESKHLLHALLYAAMLSLAASANANDAPSWRVHASIASDALRGTLLDSGDGVARALGYDDAFGRSDRQAIGLGFLIAPNQELSLNRGIDRAGGKTVALGATNGVTQAAALSRFEALRYELGYRYSFSDANQSGFFVGTQIGRERHNAVSARLANGRTETLFDRSSGYSFGVSGGYQWAFGAHAALALEIAPTRRPGFEVNRAGAAVLGVRRSGKTSGSTSMPVSLRFSYSF
jgi:hypothetical protein